MPPGGINGLNYDNLEHIYTKVNSILSAYTSISAIAASVADPLSAQSGRIGSKRAWLTFAAAAFLVSVPVFVQAPLVRAFPWLSLVLTAGWLFLSGWLLSHPRPASRFWGDLLLGFSACWLAGSIYWGWLRWEPLLHLPVEAIALPLTIWGLKKNWYKTGIFFYLGSLFGTAITDFYFYLVDVVPYWRQIMQVDTVDTSLAITILKSALAQVQTPWGVGWAMVLVLSLLAAGLLPLTLTRVRLAHPHALHWWGFAGAVLSTILVDGLFFVAAAVS